MSRKVTNRWKSKFARFVRSYGRSEDQTGRRRGITGAALLAQHLGVHPTSIYQWIRGFTTPRPQCAFVIRRLASERGIRLTLDQIYEHSLEFRAGARLHAKSDIALPRESGPGRPVDVIPFPQEPARRAAVAQALARLGK
jgi:hypothetical protein